MSTLLSGFSRESVGALSAEVYHIWSGWKKGQEIYSFTDLTNRAKAGDAEAKDTLDRLEAHLVALTLKE